MPRKSIRFIGLDLHRSYDQVAEAIDALNISPDGYSDMGTATYSEEAQRRIQVYLNAGIDWYCDNCGTFLNDQPGFTTRKRTWVCKECGCENDVTENNLR